MKIECVLRRNNGSTIALGNRVYHFKPEDAANPESPHVCDVDDEDDIGRLLSITEAYRLVKGDKNKAKKLVQAEAEKRAAREAEEEEGGEGEEEGEEEEESEEEEEGGEDYEALGRDDLIALIEERTGERPDGRTSKANLIETLVALDDADKENGEGEE